METTLRPLTLGEILDRTAQLYRTNFWLFAGIFSIYAGVGLILNLLQIGLVQLLRTEHLYDKLSWVPLVYAGVEMLILFLFVGATIAAISRAVASVNLGDPATIRGAYASVLPRLGRYLWLMTITFFLAWLPMGVLYGGLFAVILHFKGAAGAGAQAGAVAVARTPAQAQQTMMMAIALGVIFLLMIPAFVYAIWMTLRYALAVPACVVENLEARKAIRRSVELSKGARWRILVLGLLIAAIKIGLVGITQAFVFVSVFRHHGQVAAGVNALSQVIAFFTNTFLGPIGAAGVTLFYFDQRVRKEGFDIEWMMQSAGLGAAPPAPEPQPEALAPESVEPPAPEVLVPAVPDAAPAASAEPPPPGDPV